MKNLKIKEISIINPKSNIKNMSFMNYIDTSSVFDGSLLNIQLLENDFPSRAQRTLQTNDILISSVRPCLKHNYLVNIDLPNLVGSSGFIQIRLSSNEYLPKYLYYFLTSDRNVKHFDMIANYSQTAFPTFNKDVIEEMEIPAIGLSEQQHIVNIVR